MLKSEETKQFSSKDFHQTFARPVYAKPTHLIHKNVEKQEYTISFPQKENTPYFCRPAE